MLARMRSAGSGCRLGVGLILLALWLQALAPVVRLRLEAVQPLQAVAGAVICGHDQAGPDGVGNPSAPAPGPCHDCPFCRAHASPPIPVAPQPSIRRLSWDPVSWPIPPPPVPLAPPPSGRLARAPPAV